MTEAEYQARADPIPAHWGGLGAVRRVPDSRDYPALWHPDVREILLAGGADSVDWTNKVCSIENQGMDGSCVAYSTCSGIQLNENINQSVCYRFNATQLYHELGGTGPNGVDSRQTLERCKSVGAPLVNSAGRVRVGSYFWIDQNPANFVPQVKAALVSGKSVVMALLLPSTFSGKWTPGNVTQGYHQLPLVGTLGDLFWGPNSWSESWPGPGGSHPAGFYELSFEYVTQSGMQNNYCYAYFFDTIAFDAPPPPPRAITVTGYNPNPALSGSRFSIQGSNFDKGGVTLLWQGITLPVLGMNPDALSTQAPVVTTSQTGPVHVVVGNGAAAGPPLTVKADTPPVVKGATVAGRATGDNVGQLQVNTPYALNNPPGVLVNFSQVTQDGTPPPVGLAVTGYSVNPVKAGQSFTIQGQGFTGQNLTVTWQSFPVVVQSATDTQIQAVAPSVGITGTAGVTVLVDGATATGPPLTVQAADVQPGGIKVLLTTKPSQLRNSVSVIAYTSDLNGNSLPASVNGQVVGSQGTTDLQGQTTHGTSSPAIWTVPRPSPWGTECTVTVHAYGNGLSGEATKPG